jgi:hypothetical protein
MIETVVLVAALLAGASVVEAQKRFELALPYAGSNGLFRNRRRRYFCP